MKKSRPKVSRILGPVLREMVRLLFDLDRFAEKSWVKEAFEKAQITYLKSIYELSVFGLSGRLPDPQAPKPKYAYPLKRDLKGRMMKPEEVIS